MTYISQLTRSLDGRVIHPGDPEMAEVRKQFAARLPFSEPDLLVRCASPEDVARSVSILVAAERDFSLRSGGHCFADRSNASKVIIDLSQLKRVQVDGDHAAFGAGVTAGAAVDVLAPHGGSIPTGGCIGVSVAGLAMAGGFGYRGRQLGFLADRVRSFDVVLADGRFVQVSQSSEPELFWALRGGGVIGLAAVTELMLETAPSEGGMSFQGEWPLDKAVELIDRWQRWAPYAHAGCNVELTLAVGDVPDAEPLIRLHGGTTGDDAGDMASALGPFSGDVEILRLPPEDLARYFAGRLDHRGALAWQPSYPYRDVGFQATRSHFFAQPMPRPNLADLVACASANRRYAQAREVEFIPWGGAYADPLSSACIAYRSAAILVRHTAMAGARSAAKDVAAAKAFATASFKTLAAEGIGAYAGYAELDNSRWLEDAYGTCLHRLMEVQHRYDPNGIFRNAARRHSADDREKWRTQEDSNLWPLPSEGSALSS